jgi:hypothetical protein
MRQEILGQLKNPMTSSGIELANFWLKMDVIFLSIKVTNTNTDDDEKKTKKKKKKKKKTFNV